MYILLYIPVLVHVNMVNVYILPEYHVPVRTVVHVDLLHVLAHTTKMMISTRRYYNTVYGHILARAMRRRASALHIACSARSASDRGVLNRVSWEYEVPDRLASKA